MNNKLLENYILEILQEAGEYPTPATLAAQAAQAKSREVGEYPTPATLAAKAAEKEKSKPKISRPRVNNALIGAVLSLLGGLGSVYNYVSRQEIEDHVESPIIQNRVDGMKSPADFDNLAQEIVDNVVIQQSQKETNNISINFPSYSRSSGIEFMKDAEDFAAKPYNDEGNISIGYGSNIGRGSNFKKVSNYSNINFENSSDIKKLTQVALDTYGIGGTASSDGLTEEQASEISRIAWIDREQLMRQKHSDFIEDLPGEVQHICFDLGYNVGPYVFNKFKEAKKGAKKIASGYKKFKNSNSAEDLQEVREGIVKFMDEIIDSDAYRNTTEARDNMLSAHPDWDPWKVRFEKHEDTLKSMIERIDSALNNMQNESYSLKSVFNFLYS
jgi:GH24 family phage-related lysozyme (muramidase)